MPDIAGLKLIVPTSVAGSGVSVSASGKVTFTAATTVSVNGCFTSSYDNYLVVLRIQPSSGVNDCRARLRVSGSDATGSNYTWQYVYAASTSVTAGRSTTTSFYAGTADGTLTCGEHFYFYGPNLAQPTAFRRVDCLAASGAAILDVAATHSLSTAYDGFSFYPDGGTITGALCVYGLSQ